MIITAKDLIRQLEAHPQDKPVTVYLHGQILEIKGVAMTFKGTVLIVEQTVDDKIRAAKITRKGKPA